MSLRVTRNIVHVAFILYQHVGRLQDHMITINKDSIIVCNRWSTSLQLVPQWNFYPSAFKQTFSPFNANRKSSLLVATVQAKAFEKSHFATDIYDGKVERKVHCIHWAAMKKCDGWGKNMQLDL